MQREKPKPKSGKLSVEDMLINVMPDQAQSTVDMLNNQLATQICEKHLGRFSSAQNSWPQEGLSRNTYPNPKHFNAVSTHIGLQLEELSPKKYNCEAEAKRVNQKRLTLKRLN